MEIIIKWLSGNYIELLGAILGFAYIFFSIRQNILTWPVGLLTSLLYIWVFYESGLYAEMGLQLYYVLISIYGWYQWLKGKTTDDTVPIKVSRLSFGLGAILVIISSMLFLLLQFGLKNYTDSNVPIADSMVTSLSIVATWMLARKILEHWLIWIFVNLFSIALFLHKGLIPTVILFVVYSIIAIVWFIKWKKDMELIKVSSNE